MNKGAAGNTIYRKNYTPYGWALEHVSLRFEIGDDETLVFSELHLKSSSTHDSDETTGRKLELSGQELELLSIAVNGEALSPERYQVDEDNLIIPEAPDECHLSVGVRIQPQLNTALQGLYAASGFLLTQCEAEGFRKITYFPDRPDVMAKFEVTIVADPERYPVLLSNGNLVEEGPCDDGRHWVTWNDPFPKPSYLFALVAGDLGHVEDHFVTCSGRKVTLRIYVEHRNIDRCQHAMESLINSMKWDEERFGLEYDLDVFNIVATDDFNMGAMENKSLNIFNSKYVLARPDTATDFDYQGIEGVIGHEYFHNWTGNRVTCRDWFQLTLKEGLTVFRDQEFSADMQSRAVQRIRDIRALRSYQFPEDAGPMSHPIRPDQYMEINNFYTMTVYQKGATIIRMIHTLLGEDGFQKGMRLYFERHDGQAVSCDDFLAAMADANDRDLSEFGKWYSQSGTPVIRVNSHYDEDTRRYALNFEQFTPPTHDQPEKCPLMIPMRIGLLGRDGAGMPLRIVGEEAPDHPQFERLFVLGESEHQLIFEDIDESPVPSLLRDFSAPVKLEYDYSDADLALLMACDTDAFVRWEAAQLLSQKAIIDRTGNMAADMPLDNSLVSAFSSMLEDRETDPALIAEAMTLPGEEYLAEQMTPVDVDGIHQARDFVKSALTNALRSDFLDRYDELKDSGPYDKSAPASARRSLKNVLLSYLMTQSSGYELAEEQLRHSNNMTDTLAALRGLVRGDAHSAADALAEFEARWIDDPLVMDKWFALQVTKPGPEAVSTVKRLLSHPAYSIRNPNKVRAVLGAFAAGNPTGFHARDGSGYRLLAEQVLELNGINPQIAARCVSAFNQWTRYDSHRRNLMESELRVIAGTGGLSPDVDEIVRNSLAAGDRS
jgi:aminopeptidase N